MRLVTITDILWSGLFGGAIFNGLTEDFAKYRMVASSGVMPRPPVAGESWLIEGVIRKHAQFGPQVEVKYASFQRPSGRLVVNAITKSKLFPGIGKVKAQQLWDEFGESLYKHLDRGDSTAFIDLIGSDLAGILVAGWKSLSIETEVFAWLDQHGVPVGLANKLIWIYGDTVIAKLQDNPYRLLAFTSWKHADALAQSMGIGKVDQRRLIAASDAAVYQRLQSAHTWVRRDGFIQSIKRILGCRKETANSALHKGITERSVVEVDDGIQGLGPASMERFVASKIRQVLSGAHESKQMSIRRKPDNNYLTTFFSDYQKKYGLKLNREQKESVNIALSKPLSLICGGAGVGKTTVLHAIQKAAKPLGAQLYMMALSGRAARRMSEAAGYPAMTIAAFLKAVDNGKIDLECEPTLAVDEASMVDLATIYRVLRRIKPGCRILLIGDPGQLPPISFGVVFHSLVKTDYIPCVELTEIHRQASETGIPRIARKLRYGQVPDLDRYGGQSVGVSFISCQKGKIADNVLDVVYEIGGFDNAQIISPIKSGPAGTRSINHLCHEMLSPGRPMYHGFALGEPVIWLANNYELGLMNGSLGRIIKVARNLIVKWDEGEMNIEDTRDIELSYAITVHKAQGSQFSRVVMPVFGSRLLDRTLIYTAITRAQHQVVLVGDRMAFERSVIEQPNSSRRQTAMEFYLK